MMRMTVAKGAFQYWRSSARESRNDVHARRARLVPIWKWYWLVSQRPMRPK
jgi:hypothetical protein